MGPIVREDGVAFRVWAPHAEHVTVVGDFNEWNPQSHPMTREPAGNWYTLVSDAVPGNQYQYEITYQGNTFRRIDPRVRQVTHSDGNGVIHDPEFDWQGDNFSMPPWNQLVIYETHVGTFFRSNDDQVGTFQDFTQKFDHLKRLGVNALQLMPVAEFAGDISWGYNPAHPYAIESAYGGPLGLKTFVRDAHRAGFAVILDVVYNHFGPSDLDLWQFDGWSENGKGGIYFYNDYRSNTPWGDTRPDYGRGEVRSYLRDNAMMWLEDYHVDGLRYDMTLYIRSVDGNPQSEIPEGWSLTQWINREIHQVRPDAITIAEDLQNNDYLTKSEEQGGAGFSAQWDAKFVHPIRAVISEIDDASRDMYQVCQALQFRYNGDPFQRVIYTESHDEVANGKSRVPSEIDPADPDNYFAQKRSALGIALVMTAPGIPMLFQGQAILQDGWFQDTEELSWENAETHRGIVDLTARLIALRCNRDGVTAGLRGPAVDVHHVNQQDKVVAFVRSHSDGSHPVVVVVNFANRSWQDYRIGFPNDGDWYLRFNSDWSGYSDVFDDHFAGDLQATAIAYDGLPSSGLVDFGPYTVLIFSQAN